MGQRHQIYFVLPDQTARKHVVVGLHHQWLYGSQPLRKLEQFLKFVQAGATGPNTYFMRDDVPAWMLNTFRAGDHADSDTIRTLHAVYGLDLESGSFYSLHTLDDGVCVDPRRGDNNDGITIIDLRKPLAPKFAFLFFSGGDPDVSPGCCMVPMSATTYLSLYYHRGTPLSDNDERDAAPDGSWELAERLDASYKRLTLAQLRKLFPVMFADVAATVE